MGSSPVPSWALGAWFTISWSCSSPELIKPGARAAAGSVPVGLAACSAQHRTSQGLGAAASALEPSAQPLFHSTGRALSQEGDICQPSGVAPFPAPASPELGVKSSSPAATVGTPVHRWPSACITPCLPESRALGLLCQQVWSPWARPWAGYVPQAVYPQAGMQDAAQQRGKEPVLRQADPSGECGWKTLTCVGSGAIMRALGAMAEHAASCTGWEFSTEMVVPWEQGMCAAGPDPAPCGAAGITPQRPGHGGSRAVAVVQRVN